MADEVATREYIKGEHGYFEGSTPDFEKHEHSDLSTGQHTTHSHADTLASHPGHGPAKLTISKQQWGDQTGLKGGGTKQFTKGPTGPQLPFAAKAWTDGDPMTEELEPAAEPAPPTPAIRTLSEDDDFRTIEGRAVPFGGPFNGKDAYGTFFSARSNLAIDLPIKVWYQHGFDPDFGYESIGKVTAARTEPDGVWVQAQLDKRHRYYETRVKPLLEQNGLGFSAGSAEHSYRESPKTRELLDYPIHEISLTPVEANPWAFVAARSAEITEALVHITEAATGEPTPPVEEPAVRAGARNSASDQTLIQTIHDHSLALGAACGADASRSAPEPAADDQPATVTIAVREDVPDFESIRASLLAQAEENGKAVAVRMTR